MTVRELREILEEYDGEMEVVITDVRADDVSDIDKVMINVKKDNPRLALILEEY